MNQRNKELKKKEFCDTSPPNKSIFWGRVTKGKKNRIVTARYKI